MDRPRDSIAALADRSPATSALAPGVGRHPRRAGPRQAGRPTPCLPFASLGEALCRRAEHTPHETAFYHLDLRDRVEEVSCGDLRTAAAAAAAGLRERRVAAGDRVLLCFETTEQATTAFFACALLGAVPVLVAPPRGRARVQPWKETLIQQCRLTGARGVVVSDSWRERFREATLESKNTFVAGFSDVALAGGDVSEVPEAPGEAPIYLQFSSGTTGPPRAARVTHDALLANVSAIGELSAWNDDDLVVSWLPLHHDMGLVGLMLAPFYHGLPVVLVPSLAFMLRPSRWLWAIHHFRATVSGGPNFAYHLCARKILDRDIEGLDLDSWRMAYNGAELVNPETVRLFTERFGPCGFRADATFPVYGLAETVVAATFPTSAERPRIDTIDRDALNGAGRAVAVSPESAAAMSLVGVGRVLPGHELRIVDARGKALPERHQGEILLRGPSLAAGYFDDERQTRRAFRDGWLRTGDLGYVADGELFVCGRAKDLIVRAGRNYHPQAFEVAAAGIEGVRPDGVAAFGAPDDTIGTERVVIVFETAVVEEKRRRHLCNQMQQAVSRSVGVGPDHLVPVPPRTLPRTSSGKLARAALRQRYLAGAFG